MPPGEDECWNWRAGVRTDGYGQFTMSGKHWAAHRLAYTLARGDVPYGIQVLHTCDNNRCCRPDHLYIGTHEDNMRDRDSRNRTTKGENHHNAKLTEKDVVLIRSLYARGKRQVDLAAMFHVDQTQISRVVRRKAGQGWAHVE